MQSIKTIIMSDIRESYEYKLVKQLTSKENRKKVRNIIAQGLLFSLVCCISFNIFLKVFLWVLTY